MQLRQLVLKMVNEFLSSCDTRKTTVIECANLRIKKIYTQLFKFIFKLRTVESISRIHREEG